MKFIKTYKTFESNDINNDIIQDIYDILLELNDENRIVANLKESGNRKYISFFLKDRLNCDGFLFDEIDEYVFRLKDYLNNNFRQCSVLLVRDKNRYGSSSYQGGNRININLNDYVQVTKLKDLPIENLIIDIK